MSVVVLSYQAEEQVLFIGTRGIWEEVAPMYATPPVITSLYLYTYKSVVTTKLVKTTSAQMHQVHTSMMSTQHVCHDPCR